MNASLRHSLFEDAQALVAAALVGSLGLGLLKQAGLITGGTVGLAFLAHYASGVSLGKLFFAINVPFMALAWFKVGRAFALKTLCAIALLSIVTDLPISLGLDAKSTVLLFLSLIVASQTLANGRTTVLQGVIHLMLFAIYLFTTFVP